MFSGAASCNVLSSIRTREDGNGNFTVLGCVDVDSVTVAVADVADSVGVVLLLVETLVHPKLVDSVLNVAGDVGKVRACVEVVEVVDWTAVGIVQYSLGHSHANAIAL